VNLPRLLFRYPGGKFYALKLLRPFWQNTTHDEYREIMVGGGAVFFDKPKVRHNWLNDKHKDLMITYSAVADPEVREQLVELFEKEVATKERHAEMKEFVPRNDFEVALRFFYLNRTSFSGKTRSPSWGWRPVRSLPPNRWKERIRPCGVKLEDTKMTCLDFEDVITTPSLGESTLLFADPPYFHAKQENHYSESFSENDHYRLAAVLEKTSHKFFLTYDDCKEIRELYSFARISQNRFVYRIDNSRDRGGRRKYGQELVITNYDPQITVEETKTHTGGDATHSEITTRMIDRSIKSPFRFPGSKAQAIKYIRPHWEGNPHDEYREPFLGGGAVFFSKPRVSSIWLNDIDEELVTTYKTMQDAKSCSLLIERVSLEEATKERHIEMKHWKPKTALDIAHRYFYLNRTSYSGIMKKPAWGYHPKKSVPPERWGPRILQAHEKLQGVKITSRDFKSVIEAPAQNDSVFMFIDPPYYEADQKRAYEHSFTQTDHVRLAAILKGTNLPFCLTYDNCEPVRDLYDWATITPVSWRYHTANSRKASRKMGQELIISNYKPE
jgi:DNA adenine methylase